MAKSSGLGHGLLVSGRDISGDVTEAGRIGGGPVLLEGSTGIDKYAMERIGGRFDGAFEVTSWFNKADDRQHDVLSALPRTDVHALYLCGATLGSAACGVIAKQVNYDGSVEEDGTYKFETELQQTAGFPVAWGRLLTANPRTDGATPTTGSSVDDGAATTAGATAFLHVLAVASGSATIAVQSSSDDGSGDAFAAVSGLSFTATAQGGQRAATAAAASIERYLRVVTTGTFTGLSFVLAVARGA